MANRMSLKNSLQRTSKSVTRFAFPKPAPLLQAAELERYVFWRTDMSDLISYVLEKIADKFHC